jgi:hypothetical protein
MERAQGAVASDGQSAGAPSYREVGWAYEVGAKRPPQLVILSEAWDTTTARTEDIVIPTGAVTRSVTAKWRDLLYACSAKESGAPF